MQKLLLHLAVVLSLVLFVDSTTMAQGRTKTSKFSVVFITSQDRTESFVVIADDLVRELQKSLDIDYRAAVKEWTDASKEAKKDKLEFKVPKPSKPALRVLAKGLDKEKAQDLRQKAESEHAKKKSAEGGRERPMKYSVLKVTLMDGSVSFQTAEEKTVAKLKDELAAEYKQAQMDWESRKREASEKRETFKEPRPLRPEVKSLKSGLSGLAAEEARRKAEEAHAKKEVKKSRSQR